jgi:hypothetical protein
MFFIHLNDAHVSDNDIEKLIKVIFKIMNLSLGPNKGK